MAKEIDPRDVRLQFLMDAETGHQYRLVYHDEEVIHTTIYNPGQKPRAIIRNVPFFAFDDDGFETGLLQYESRRDQQGQIAHYIQAVGYQLLPLTKEGKGWQFQNKSAEMEFQVILQPFNDQILVNYIMTEESQKHLEQKGFDKEFPKIFTSLHTLDNIAEMIDKLDDDSPDAQTFVEDFIANMSFPPHQKTQSAEYGRRRDYKEPFTQADMEPDTKEVISRLTRHWNQPKKDHSLN